MTIQWLYYSNKPSNLDEIINCIEDNGVSITLRSEKEELEKLLIGNPDSIIFIEVNNEQNNYQYCENLSLLYPSLYIVLVGEETELDAMKALRCGAKDILSFSSPKETVLEVMRRAEKAIQYKGNHSIPKDGRVITVCSTKGGVGKTTLIVNLASVLSKKKIKVAVLDFNLQFGDVSLYYDVKPKKTIYEWVKEGYGLTDELESFMSKHSSGVDVLSAPIRPEFSEDINEQHIQQLIEQCKQQYDFVLIDTPPYLTDHTIISLENSNDVLLMTFMDLATLKNNKIFIETLEALSIKEKVKVILNRDYKVKGIHPETVEKILEFPIFGRIPNKEKWITTSINEGKPFVLSNPKSSFSKSIENVANKLMGNETKRHKKTTITT